MLIDDRSWQAINDPDTVDSITRSLFILKAAIDSSSGGAKEASDIILASVESAYLHTAAHRAALKLYLLSLTGRLKPQDEPLQLINAAIERGTAEIELAAKGRKRGRGGGVR